MIPSKWHWDWFFWQVFLPIAGPIVVSAGIVGLWQQGPWPVPEIDWKIVFDDMSPWALSFYCVTLICVTMHEFWSRLSSHPVLGWGLIGVGVIVVVYAAIIVLFRHAPHYEVGTRLWQITFVFLVAVVYLCHSAVAALEKSLPAEALKKGA